MDFKSGITGFIVTVASGNPTAINKIVRQTMRTMQFEIPTYDPDADVEYDYAKPHNLVLQDVAGLRVVMGDPDDENAPDVIIERGVGVWRVFVHADRTDPLCIIEIRNGRATVEDMWGEFLLDRVIDS